jgi:hypothetical protein
MGSCGLTWEPSYVASTENWRECTTTSGANVFQKLAAITSEGIITHSGDPYASSSLPSKGLGRSAIMQFFGSLVTVEKTNPGLTRSLAGKEAHVRRILGGESTYAGGKGTGKVQAAGTSCFTCPHTKNLAFLK